MESKFLHFLGKWKSASWTLFFYFCLISFTSLGQTPFPFSFVNNSDYADNELYVAIIGQDMSNQRVWVDLKTGAQNLMYTSYNTVQGPVYGGNQGPGGNGKYAAIFTKLSDIPNKTFNLSGISGSRVYISIQSQLYFYFFGPTAGYTQPNPGDPNDPNRGIRFEIIEMTYNNIGIWANTSRVDAYEVPMAVEVTGASGFQMTGELISHSEIVAAYLANVPAEFQGCYNPTLGEIKQPTKTAAWQPGATYGDYLKPYVDAVWNKYKNEDLVVDMGGAGVWRGRVQSDDRLIMNCSSGGWAGRQGIVQRRPTTQEAFEGKGVLAQPIADGGADLFFQSQLCAAFTRHVINSTTPNVGTQIWSDASKYYQQSPCNHYAKFWHLPGISVNQLAYGFAYDDVNEQSSTLFASSPSKTLVVIGGYVPKVALTAPANNSTYNAPASITFQATATAATSSRTIAKIEFYNGTTKIGEDLSSPFSFNWTNVAAGTYTITAKAIDNMGVIGTSAPITVKVNAPSVPPTVSITSPINNASFIAPASISIQANATAASGSSISKVEFYNGATKIGESTSSPYTFNWTGVAVGTYSITAKAIDNNNLTATSTAISIDVKAAVPPTISITSPANGTSYFAPASITIDASATAGTSLISKVEFYNGATKIGEDLTSPYSFTWTNVPVGIYTLTAKAIDNTNLSTTSTAISIEVKATVPPTVSIISPSNNASFFAPANIDFEVSAIQGTNAIAKVQLYYGTTKIGEETTGPFVFNWTNVDPGIYTITAKAIDINNQTTTSTAITIEVKSAILPTVAITSPANGTSYFAPATIQIDADAVQGTYNIAKLEFYNGTTKIGEDVTSPYSFTWTNVPVGTYSITAKAIDIYDFTNTSAAISVDVKALVPPQVSITSPSNNSIFVTPTSLTISASATQGTGAISKVEFYNGTVKLGEDASAPFTYDWNTIDPGNYSITAKVIDINNLTFTSSVINIQVKANQAPSVSLISPAANSVYKSPANVQIEATASDVDGTIQNVEFYNGTTLIGTVTAAPYKLSLTNLVAGTYDITAKAYDNIGLTNTTTILTFKVNDNVLPQVAITAPILKNSYIAPAALTIEADANDPDGVIAKVEFYQGTIKLGEDVTGPYSFDWNNIDAGDYIITVKAIDDNGGTVTSSPINVQVKLPNKLPQVSITSPINNSSYVGPATVYITANASDEDGSILKVEFYSGSQLLGTDIDAPYTFTMTDAIAGNYVITAKAYDNFNASTTSTAINLIINQNQLPTVKIINPINNAVINSPAEITIEAVASDVDGDIKKIEFYNGSVKIAEDLTSPYTYFAANVAPGEFVINVKAYDDKGGMASASVTIKVVMPNVPPQLVIVSPTQNSTLKDVTSVDIYAVVNDVDGSIAKVEFYDGAFKIGELTQLPYSFTWTNSSPGLHEIRVVATDNEGQTTEAKTVITIETPTSTMGEYIDNKLLVYPNPTFGEIHFTKEVERLEIFNISGIKVSEMKSGGMNVVSIIDLPEGVYLLRLINGTTSEIVKITKQ